MCRRADLSARFWRTGIISRARTRGHCKTAAFACGAAYFILGVTGVVNSQSRTNTASDTIVSSLSLADAKRLAFARNWDLLAAKTDVDFATAQRLVAREFPNPVASFSVQKINIHNHSAGTSEGMVYGNAITIPSRQSISSLKSVANGAPAKIRRLPDCGAPKRAWRTPVERSTQV